MASYCACERSEPAHRSVGPNSFGRRHANGRTSSTLRYRPSPAALVQIHSRAFAAAVLTLRCAHAGAWAQSGQALRSLPCSCVGAPATTTRLGIPALSQPQSLPSAASPAMVRAFSFQVCCPKRALNGKPVRSSEQSRRCPRNGNRPRSPEIAVRSNATVPRHGKASAMRVESPETGLSGFDWCCGGQHRQARLPVSGFHACSCPPQKCFDLLRICYR